MDQPAEIILGNWHNFAQTAGFVLVLLSVLYLFFYFGVTAVITERTTKYKFISNREINVLWYSALGILLAGALFLNTLIVGERDLNNLFALALKVLLPLALLTMVGYGIYVYLKVYYPFSLDKKLSDIRFKPKLSPTGKPMRLLNEEEEDKYLTKEMIKEEDMHHFDYDVWLDEETGVTVIEKYPGDSKIRVCPNCSFKTLKLTSEEESKSEYAYDKDVIIQKFECSYCGYRDKEEQELD